jgi:hypothetical protein
MVVLMFLFSAVSPTRTSLVLSEDQTYSSAGGDEVSALGNKSTDHGNYERDASMRCLYCAFDKMLITNWIKRDVRPK